MRSSIDRLKSIQNLMRRRGVKFNVIFIIQSLSPDERQTGDEIVQQIKYACLRRGLEPMGELVIVESKKGFFELISQIRESIEHGVRPYLHFEMHGSPQGGLSLSSGENISWNELKEPIRKINIACKNNLYVSLATCHGANFLDMYKGEFDKPCPFFGYIGATSKVDAFDFEVSFTSFFQALLTEDSITSAIKALHMALPMNTAEYIFIDCELYQTELMKAWDKEYGSMDAKHRFVEYLFQRAKREFPYVDKPDDQIKKELEDMAFGSYTNDYFAKCKQIFLHEIPY